LGKRVLGTGTQEGTIAMAIHTIFDCLSHPSCQGRKSGGPKGGGLHLGRPIVATRKTRKRRAMERVAGRSLTYGSISTKRKDLKKAKANGSAISKYLSDCLWSGEECGIGQILGGKLLLENTAKTSQNRRRERRPHRGRKTGPNPVRASTHHDLATGKDQVLAVKRF